MATAKISRLCSIENCENPRAHQRTFCSTHWSRKCRTGQFTLPEGRHSTKWKTWDKEFIDFFWRCVNKTENLNDCWEWKFGVGGGGYGVVVVESRQWRANRLAWMYTHGGEPVLMILHSCDNRLCCNPNHLREGTAKENADDRDSRNRHKVQYGEQHPFARLTEIDVQSIRRRFAQGERGYIIARDYPVSQGTIDDVLHKRTWKHVQI